MIQIEKELNQAAVKAKEALEAAQKAKDAAAVKAKEPLEAAQKAKDPAAVKAKEALEAAYPRNALERDCSRAHEMDTRDISKTKEINCSGSSSSKNVFYK